MPRFPSESPMTHSGPRSAGLFLLLLASCGPVPGSRIAWDGRRGYDGNGDYGYDLDAPREAGTYEARASAAYPSPGPPGDPWGPYIQEAATRFGVPVAWIRGVMRQESGGRETDGDGNPITSSAGAMGLMQVMPGTYDLLRGRYSLGADPYAPHDNILAGAAYIREMYDRFGAPGFLAAYNAGPERLDAYLTGTSDLPDETVNYVASIGPRLGMAGSLEPVAYVGATAPITPADPSDASYAGGGMTGDDDSTGIGDAVPQRRSLLGRAAPGSSF